MKKMIVEKGHQSLITNKMIFNFLKLFLGNFIICTVLYAVMDRILHQIRFVDYNITEDLFYIILVSLIASKRTPFC